MEIEIRTEINEIRDKYLIESSIKTLFFSRNQWNWQTAGKLDQEI